MADHVRVETTIDNGEAANRLSRSLVEEQLAACVQVVGPITSTYRWERSVTTDEEWLVIMKTASDRLDPLVARLRELHPYDVPEIVAVPVVGGNPDYLTWVTAETRHD